MIFFFCLLRDGPELKRDENGQIAEVRLPSKLSTAMSFLTVIGTVTLGGVVGGTFSQAIGNRFLLRDTWMVRACFVFCINVVTAVAVALVEIENNLCCSLADTTCPPPSLPACPTPPCSPAVSQDVSTQGCLFLASAFITTWRDPKDGPSIARKRGIKGRGRD